MEGAIQEIRDPNQRQKLHILVPPTFATRWLTARLADFRYRFPELELSIHDHRNDQVRFDCEIRFGRTAQPKHFSELLFLEQHVLVCEPELRLRADSLEKESNNLLHILHDGKKLPVWEDWLSTAQLSDIVDAKRGIEFSTLDQVINAIKAKVGFAVIDKNMISNELRDKTLVQHGDIEVSGPYGYWIDIPADNQGLSKVIHFTDWLREQRI